MHGSRTCASVLAGSVALAACAAPLSRSADGTGAASRPHAEAAVNAPAKCRNGRVAEHACAAYRAGRCAGEERTRADYERSNTGPPLPHGVGSIQFIELGDGNVLIRVIGKDNTLRVHCRNLGQLFAPSQ